MGLDGSVDTSKNQTFDNIRVKTTKKEVPDFGGLTKTQTHIRHQAKIWTMKFARDGSLLASGDSKGVIYVWSVGLHPIEASRSKQRERLAALNIPDNSSNSQHDNDNEDPSIGAQQSNKFKLLHEILLDVFF